MKRSTTQLSGSAVPFLGGIMCMSSILVLRWALREWSFSFGDQKRKPVTFAAHDLPLLLELTIEAAAEGFRLGNFTSVELTKAYLARIGESSSFNAVLQINPDALLMAKQLDEERARCGPRGPLHGIPILIKDNIVTQDKLEASAGSFALLGAKPAIESSVISKCRKAGVVILGKTNLSEWANFRGLNISSGWSPRGGQTLGTYHPNAQPEGSSSGSAVAVALALSLAAIGTETWGSILGPAEKNAVVGLKPSRGLVANDGTIPISSRQDVIGPMTRTVKDAAHLLTFMAGRSELDERTWNIPRKFDPIPDFTQFCKGTSLQGVSIGVPRNAFDLDPNSPIKASFERGVKTLEVAGARIVDNANFPNADEFRKLNQEVKGIVRSSEFNRDIARYLKTLKANPNNIHTTEDLIEFTKTCPKEEFPDKDIGKFLWTQAEGIDVNSEKYKHMVQQEEFFGGEGGILGALDKYKVDLLVVPSSFNIATDLAAKMGFPEVSVPLGFYPEDTPVKRDSSKPCLVTVAPGIPYSLTFLSKSFSEDVLLRVGYAFEQLTRVREKGPGPFKVPTTELKDVRRKRKMEFVF